MGETGSFAAFLRSPATVLLFSLGGGIFGILRPDAATLLRPVGDSYLGLLKLIVLPFMISSIIFSLRAMINDKRSTSHLSRMFVIILGASVATAFLTAAAALILKPGTITSAERRAEIGHVLNDSSASYNTSMTLEETGDRPDETSVLELVLKVIPSNIFGALTDGNTLQVLIFSILFGFALGTVPFDASGSLASGLEAVYQTCMVLTRWFILLLPFGSFSMIAAQTAVMGLKPLMTMIGFLSTLGLITLVMLLMSIQVIARRSGESFLTALLDHGNLFMMAVSTRSSVACIPLIIDILVKKLGFERHAVELLVPLQTVLLRLGSIVLYVLGSIFIAQLYGRELLPSELLMICFYAIMLGLSTAGMAGVIAVAQLSIICSYLGLPFEAAFILFLAVETVADALRTLILVATISAATASIAPAPPIQARLPDG